MDLTAFLEMGGYAQFIWPSYGVVAVVMIGLLVLSLRTLKTAQSGLDALGGGRDNSEETQ